MGCAQWMGLLGPPLGVYRRAQWPPRGGSEQYTLSTLQPGDCGSTRRLPTRTPIPAGSAGCTVRISGSRQGHASVEAYHPKG